MSQKCFPILIMDYETGGKDAKINPIVEFAGIAIDGVTLEEIARYEAIIAPYSDELLYDEESFRIHGITMEQIKSGVDFKTFSKEYVSFMKKVNIHSHIQHRPIIAGHNIGFDIAFKQHQFHYMGKNISDFFACSEDFYGNLYPKYFDTNMLARVKWSEEGTMMNYQLSTCVDKIGNEIVNAHRAMNDVKANTDLLINFLRSLRDGGKPKSTAVAEIEKRFRHEFKFGN